MQQHNRLKPFKWWMYLFMPFGIMLLPIVLAILPLLFIASFGVSFFCMCFNIKEPEWVDYWF